MKGGDPMLQVIRDVLTPIQNLVIEESAEVDGEHILAKIRGDFFVPDGTSRNNRYYSRQVWENVLADLETQAKLTERRMFGTISHEQPIDDKAVLEGKVAHIMTRIWLDGSHGMGEALVLNTPAGRILNTMLRAKASLYTSSRARGDFDGEHNGAMAVDPSKYKLETFDFVTDPGFLQANPKIVEGLSHEMCYVFGNRSCGRDLPCGKFEEKGEEKNSIDEGGIDGMGNEGIAVTEKVMERLSTENGRLREDLENATGDLATARNESVTLKSQITAAHAEIVELKKKATMIEEYQKVAANPAEMIKALETAEKHYAELKQWRSLGSTVTETKNALVGAKARLLEYAPIGKPKDIRECIQKAKIIVAGYRAIGTRRDIREVFQRTKNMLLGIRSLRLEKRSKDLSAELGVPMESIKKVMEKGMSDAEIRTIFKDLKESQKIRTRFEKKADETKPKQGDGNGIFDKPRGKGLMESFAKPSTPSSKNEEV